MSRKMVFANPVAIASKIESTTYEALRRQAYEEHTTISELVRRLVEQNTPKTSK